ncbi:MAG: hypothetical protein ACOH19_01700 [Rhodoglobus sp.]
MKTTRALTIAASPLLLGAMIFGSAQASYAAVSQDDVNVAADAAGYVIVGTESAVETGGATFYPTGEISDDTLVVIANPDGSLPNGLTEETLTAVVAERRAAEAAGTALPDTSDISDGVVARLTGAYSATSAGWSSPYTGGSLIGIDDSSVAGYGFNVAPNSSQVNVGSGLGYYRGYNGSEFGIWATWYNLGSASDGTPGGSTVPWGNVAATTQFRAQCATTTVCGGYFTAP